MDFHLRCFDQSSQARAIFKPMKYAWTKTVCLFCHVNCLFWIRVFQKNKLRNAFPHSLAISKKEKLKEYPIVTSAEIAHLGMRKNIACRPQLSAPILVVVIPKVVVRFGLFSTSQTPS